MDFILSFGGRKRQKTDDDALSDAKMSDSSEGVFKKPLAKVVNNGPK